MGNVRPVAPAPALAASTPDPSCTTHPVFRFQVGAGPDQGLDNFQAVVFRCHMKRGPAVLSRVGDTAEEASASTSSSYTVLGPTHTAFRLDIRPRSDEHLGDLRRLIVLR